MGSYIGANIILDNLIFCIDPSSDKCYSSGSKTFDLINNQSGTLTNGASFSSKYAGGFDFDGIDDFINFGSITSSDPISLAGLSDFTIEVWLSHNDISSGDDYQRIIDKSSSSGGANGYTAWIRTSAGNEGTLTTRRNANTSDSPVFTDTIEIDDKIYCLCVVRNPSNNIFTKDYTLFRNGTFYKDQNVSSPAAISSNTNEMRIANWPHGNDRCLNGSIYALRVYNRALTEKEVLKNYISSRGRFNE